MERDHQGLVRGSVSTCGKGDCRPPRAWRQGARSCRWKGVGKLPAAKWRHILHTAATRNLEVTIDIDFAWNLFQRQNERCALTGQLLDFRARTAGTASLDRIDSSKGYTPDNVQWVDKHVNLMKRSLTNSEFIAICRAVAAHHPPSPAGEPT